MTAVVGEAHKWKLIPNKGFGDGEGLLLSPVLLDIIKITRINVTAQLRNHRGGRYMNKTQKREREIKQRTTKRDESQRQQLYRFR